VYEEYYNDYTRDQLHPIYSVTKTFTSALVGIAIDQGLIGSVEDAVLDYFPDYPDILHNDSLKQAIKIKHLLSMTSGLGSEVGVYDSDNYVEYMLNVPMDTIPGTVWRYSAGNTILLGGIIQTVAGESVEDYASQYLFPKIGITDWFWNTGPNNLTGTSGGLQVTPRDMAAFGQLYLQHGHWNGEQIISKAWIEASTALSVDFARNNYGYCYQMYRFIDTAPVPQLLQTNDLFFASGSQKQKIYVIPHFNLVVTLTSANANADAILEQVLLAVTDRLTITSDTDNITSQKGLSMTSHPNPLKQSTLITYTLDQPQHVTLTLYDHLGRVVDTLVNARQGAGSHSIRWDTQGAPSGTYTCKLQAANTSVTIQLILK